MEHLVRVSKLQRSGQSESNRPIGFGNTLPEVELRVREPAMPRSICTITSPEAAALLLHPILNGRLQESFIVVAIDTRNSPIAWYEVARGTGNSVHVVPRDVFTPAFQLGAMALIVAHNHPSGDATPSPEDHTLTHRLVEAGKLLGVPVLDHLILGSGEYYSHEQDGIRRLP